MTVVLEAGLTAAASSWCLVQPELAKSTCVLAVSRAGYGGSTPAGRRAAHASVDDLEAVLDDLGLDGPLVLVGHSWGALLVRLLAQRRPDQVRALVLVDATHERFTSMRRSSAWPLGQLGMLLGSLHARSGLLGRQLASGRGPLGELADRLPAPERATAAAELTDPRTWRQARRDHPAVGRLLRELTVHPLPVPEVPVVAIIGGHGEGSAAKARQLMRSTYTAWTAELPLGRVVVSPISGHLVPLQDPDVIVRTVQVILDP